MDRSNTEKVPNQIKNRVRDNPQSYIGRDLELNEKYRYGDEIDHEPVKAIQKEVDGMARLLCAIITDEGEPTESTEHYIEIYQNEVEKLRGLERDVISELPERERDG